MPKVEKPARQAASTDRLMRLRIGGYQSQVTMLVATDLGVLRSSPRASRCILVHVVGLRQQRPRYALPKHILMYSPVLVLKVGRELIASIQCLLCLHTLSACPRFIIRRLLV